MASVGHVSQLPTCFAATEILGEWGTSAEKPQGMERDLQGDGKSPLGGAASVPPETELLAMTACLPGWWIWSLQGLKGGPLSPLGGLGALQPFQPWGLQQSFRNLASSCEELWLRRRDSQELRARFRTFPPL